MMYGHTFPIALPLVRAACWLAWLSGCAPPKAHAPETTTNSVRSTSRSGDASTSESAELAAGASAQPFPSDPTAAPPEAPAYWVEVAEADTIRVRSVDAITVEANEIRCDHVERVDYFPTPKDMHFARLEGQLIVGDSLVAHHVRARLLIADELTAHKIAKLRSPLAWSAANEATPSPPRCLDREGLPARCTLDGP